MNPTTEQLLEEASSLPQEMQREVLDFVQFLKAKAIASNLVETRKSSMADIAGLMEEIARRGTVFRNIDDPVSWQREVRKDRSLPGRESL